MKWILYFLNLGTIVVMTASLPTAEYLIVQLAVTGIFFAGSMR
jgi:hypothetical protein